MRDFIQMLLIKNFSKKQDIWIHHQDVPLENGDKYE